MRVAPVSAFTPFGFAGRALARQERSDRQDVAVWRDWYHECTDSSLDGPVDRRVTANTNTKRQTSNTNLVALILRLCGALTG